MGVRRVSAAFAAGALLLVLPGCGQKTDERTRAAGVVPPDAVAFFTVSLDPSLEQKRNLLEIARKFPDADVKGEFEDNRDRLLTEALEKADLDYKTEVEPWLGSELALAALPGDANGPDIVVLVRVDDEDEAERTLDRALTKEGSEAAYRLVDGFAVIAPSRGREDNEALVAALAEQAQSGPGLADAPKFSRLVDELHGDRLLLGWIDPAKAAESWGSPAGSLGLGASIGNRQSPLAFDLHAASSSLVLEGVGDPNQSPAGRARLAAGLPADTLAALSVFELGGTLAHGLGSQGEQARELERTFTEFTGLDLQADILSWMKGESVVVVGPVPEGGRIPDLALIVEPTDRARAEQGVARIRAALSQRAGVELEPRQIEGTTAFVLPRPLDRGVQPAMALFRDRFVVATRPQYLATLVRPSSPSLESTEEYATVVGRGSSTESQAQLLVRMGPVLDAFAAAMPPEERAEFEREVEPTLRAVEAIGMRSWTEDDFGRFEVEVNFDG